MQNPAWNLDTEYTGFDSAEFKKDRARVETIRASVLTILGDIQGLFHKATSLSPAESQKFVTHLQKIGELDHEAMVLMWNMSTYTHCQLSVDGSLEEAKKISSQLSKMQTQMEEATKPVELFLMRTSESLFNEYLNHPITREREFYLREERKKQDFLLSEGEELLLTSLRQPGLSAWGELYNNLCGTIKCDVEFEGKKQTMGLGQTYAWLFNADEKKRNAAYTALHSAWAIHQESAAMILNSLAQFRLEEYKKRSQKRPMDFLTNPLHDNKIERKTLQAMMAACERNAPEIRKALTAMAKVLKKEKLDPWDLNAPAPLKNSQEIPFSEGLKMVQEAFSEVNPEFGQFVGMMAENNWIEGRVLPNKRQGAYCTGFPKSRTPRVFQTYTGSVKDVTTLAHELGHAYHSWVMKDMPLYETFYPMTLAETASIFAETTLAEYLQKKAKSKEDAFEVAWGDANEAVGLLLNIPARYEFESNFYKIRDNGFCSAKDLSDMTEAAWKKWYGDTLTAADRMFWAHKLHFSIAGTSFYNFPYTFGYLFSLSIYARKDQLGAGFKKKYIEILRDTGRMTAEDLIQKHLGEDITQPEFWQKSIDVVKRKVDHFVSLT